MQAVFLKKQGSLRARGVVVFALGWAASDELVRHLDVPEEMDFCVLFDYRDMTLSGELPGELPGGWVRRELMAYGERYLAGWSFGVWAAGEALGGVLGEVDWRAAVAVNGTPRPIDDRYGIPQRAFALTVRGIEAAGTMKFLERMCGDGRQLDFYMRHRSTRPLDQVGEELRRLAAGCAATSVIPSSLCWTKAIVGGRDAIFPPDNMTRYWQEAGVAVERVEQLPHYPFGPPVGGGFLDTLFPEIRSPRRDEAR